MTIATEAEPPPATRHDELRLEFERHLQPLLGQAFRLAYAMLRDHPEAEDAVQQAALDAWRSFGRFRDGGRGIAPWFLTIVANQCRARRRSPWWRLGRPRAEEWEPATDAPSHEDRVILHDALARSFAGLSAEQRAVLFLYLELDLPQEEVARILGIRVGAVKQRLHRAMRRLRSALREEDYGRDA